MRNSNSTPGMTNLIRIFRLEQELQRARLNSNISQQIQILDEIIFLKKSLPNRFGFAKTLIQKALLLEQIGLTKDALYHYKNAQNLIQNSSHPVLNNEIQQQINRLERQFK